MRLPGHAESYNPPPEYVPNENEKQRYLISFIFLWINSSESLLFLTYDFGFKYLENIDFFQIFYTFDN